MLELLRNDAYKGETLARAYKVSRQVIVNDIAILRAEGNAILGTRDGYILIGKEEATG